MANVWSEEEEDDDDDGGGDWMLFESNRIWNRTHYVLLVAWTVPKVSLQTRIVHGKHYSCRKYSDRTEFYVLIDKLRESPDKQLSTVIVGS